jgi:hypothetical protein
MHFRGHSGATKAAGAADSSAQDSVLVMPMPMLLDRGGGLGATGIF